MKHGEHLNNIQMCPIILVQCSNLPHVQTRNITVCYNKDEIITKDIYIPQDKGHISTEYDIIQLNSTKITQTRNS